MFLLSGLCNGAMAADACEPATHRPPQASGYSDYRPLTDQAGAEADQQVYRPRQTLDKSGWQWQASPADSCKDQEYGAWLDKRGYRPPDEYRDANTGDGDSGWRQQSQTHGKPPDTNYRPQRSVGAGGYPSAPHYAPYGGGYPGGGYTPYAYPPGQYPGYGYPASGQPWTGGAPWNVQQGWTPW